ncbi:MAG: NRDE family protein, partial [Bacteroidota bacterium]
THEPEPYRVASGVRGLSNATLDVPWPKVTRGKRALSTLLNRDAVAPEALFGLLANTERAPDADLPKTGVGLDWERTLSPIYIASPDYGTRASTVLLLERDGGGVLFERTTAPEASGEARRFTLRPKPSGAMP